MIFKRAGLKWRSPKHLRPEEFRLLRDALNAYAGLHFPDDAAYLFERRLAPRLDALGLNSFDEYYKYLRFHLKGPGEFEQAMELLTTKETYFFRQEYQLRAFRDEVLPKLWELNRKERRLSVWSAGCSSGEEVYSIAILIHQTGLFKGWDVRVIGSDLSRLSVARARAAVYHSGSFRVTQAQLLASFFTEVESSERMGPAYQVADEIRQMCQFGQLNLLDARAAAVVGSVDAIFCRNVMIYFDVQSRRRVIDLFYERLRPGGYLMLGHSESLLNISTAFELVHLSEDLVYRRPMLKGPAEEAAAADNITQGNVMKPVRFDN